MLTPSHRVIPTSTIGAIQELIVASDLMSKGFEVYRALSPASKYDLLAIKERVVYQIEVRIGHYYKNQVKYVIDKPIKPYYAVVTKEDNKIHYFPTLE